MVNRGPFQDAIPRDLSPVRLIARGDTGAAVSASTERVRRLVVEDELKVGNALRDGLHGEGYEVVAKATGVAALRRCGQESFDLILLDLGLPDFDGLDVIATLPRPAPGVDQSG
jgi:PleD family two-component response regulator